MYPTVFAIVSLLGASPAPSALPKVGDSSSCEGVEAMPPEVVGFSSVDPWRPPFVLGVEGPEEPKPGESFRLRITVERNLVEKTPMRISLDLPSGVELVEGQSEERVVHETSTTLVREFTLRAGASLPEESVIVTVEQRGEGWGATATKTYDFGRAPIRALEADLERGPPVDLGGGLIVHPVRVD